MQPEENTAATDQPSLGYLLTCLSSAARKTLQDVLTERGRQDRKFPNQQHPAATWLAILLEECGEAAQAALHTQFGGSESGRLREEIVQVTAVGLSMLLAIDEGRCWLPVGPETPPPPPATTPATAGQKEEILRLLGHPDLPRTEKTRGLLRLNNGELDGEAAGLYIRTLGQLIRAAEESGPSNLQAAA